jgi:hypothetical protein
VKTIKDRWELKLTKPLASISLWVFVFLFSLILGVSVSIYTSNWGWFGRTGSIATVSGLLLVMRPIMRKGIVNQTRSSGMSEIIEKEDGSYQEWIDPQEIKDGTAALVGAIFTIIGTIVWGFGDLI